jgi:tripartite-type tricarboxylate transporter receptor subunit TctC
LNARRQSLWEEEMSNSLRSAMAAALAVAAWHAQALPNYPRKPIRLIVASGAGGGLDFVARTLAAPVSEALGQTVVVDNRAGASGSIAAELSAAAPPDGYTLMLLSASLVVYGIANKTRYDLNRDFAPVSQVAAAPYILTVHPSLPVKSVREMVAYAQGRPGKLNYASTGNASLPHLASEYFAIVTGVRLVHIPYKGVGAALTDLLSGQVQMSLLSMGSIYAQVRAQKLKPIAIASATRAKMAPDIPTMIESGVPDYVVTQWHGMLAPRGTPRSVIERLHREIARAVNLPDVAARFALDGTEAIASAPEAFGTHLAAERERWMKVAAKAQIRSE